LILTTDQAKPLTQQSGVPSSLISDRGAAGAYRIPSMDLAKLSIRPEEPDPKDTVQDAPVVNTGGSTRLVRKE
jgi:hypothetical protein